MFTICSFNSPDVDGHRAPKMKYILRQFRINIKNGNLCGTDKSLASTRNSREEASGSRYLPLTHWACWEMLVRRDILSVWSSCHLRSRGNRPTPESSVSASAKQSGAFRDISISLHSLPRCRLIMVFTLLVSCVAIGTLCRSCGIPAATMRHLGDTLIARQGGSAYFSRFRMPQTVYINELSVHQDSSVSTDLPPNHAVIDDERMMVMPTVSIAAPCLGRDILSHRADLFLDSISKQTLLPLELILVISGATDQLCSEQATIARTLLPLSVHLTVNCTTSKTNQADARNFASKLASGDLIMFSDADDPLHRERVEIVTSIFRDRENLKVFSHSFTNSKNRFNQSLSLVTRRQRFVPSTIGSNGGNDSVTQNWRGEMAHSAPEHTSPTADSIAMHRTGETPSSSISSSSPRSSLPPSSWFYAGHAGIIDAWKINAQVAAETRVPVPNIP